MIWRQWHLTISTYREKKKENPCPWNSPKVIASSYVCSCYRITLAAFLACKTIDAVLHSLPLLKQWALFQGHFLHALVLLPTRKLATKCIISMMTTLWQKKYQEPGLWVHPLQRCSPERPSDLVTRNKESSQKGRQDTTKNGSAAICNHLIVAPAQWGGYTTTTGCFRTKGLR